MYMNNIDGEADNDVGETVRQTDISVINWFLIESIFTANATVSGMVNHQ